MAKFNRVRINRNGLWPKFAGDAGFSFFTLLLVLAVIGVLVGSTYTLINNKISYYKKENLKYSGFALRRIIEDDISCTHTFGGNLNPPCTSTPYVLKTTSNIPLTSVVGLSLSATCETIGTGKWLMVTATNTKGFKLKVATDAESKTLCSNYLNVGKRIAFSTLNQTKTVSMGTCDSVDGLTKKVKLKVDCPADYSPISVNYDCSENSGSSSSKSLGGVEWTKIGSTTAVVRCCVRASAGSQKLASAVCMRN